jgi:hypothetical protein
MTVSGLRAVTLATLSLCVIQPARAQLIPVKTIPLAQGNQFQIFPSANLGMGSISIALEDPIQDPFVNPATGSRLEVSRFFSSPTVYSVTRGTGGGRSLPLAVLARRANWYGGLALALQQVEPSRPPEPDGGVVFAGVDPLPPFGPGQVQVVPGPDLRAHGNQFAFAMVGRSIATRNISIGASVLWNGLHAVDGVDLLYDGSRRLSQSGHSLDLRAGALKGWSGVRGSRSLEAILLHNRFRARHDVTFADLFWDPATQQFQEQARHERNFDHTSTWGLQLNYRMPLAAPGWRIGWLAVANRSSHPRIPNYELTNLPAIPRDPGRTTAYNLGIGVAKMRGLSRFGVDLIYEPIASYTWDDADAPVLTSAGDTIAVGGKMIENRFRFSNALFRIGVDEVVRLKDADAIALQLGLIIHSINYRLRQRDHVQLQLHSLKSSWVEWTPTWGLSVRLPTVELRYQGRATKGAGRPQSNFFFGGPVLHGAGLSIIGPPPIDSRLVMTDVSTVTHQISVSLPLR